MAIDFGKYIFDRIDTVTLFDKTTGSCRFIFDEIKDGTLENAAEKVFGTGVGGRRISALDRNKTAKFSCTNGFIVGGAIAVQTGTDISSETEMVTPWMEYITVGATTTSITTTYKAIGVAGAEVKLYKANGDNSLGVEVAQAASASTTAFAYTPATKTITLPTSGVAEGDVYIAFYDYKATGIKITNSGNDFPKAGKLVIDVLIKDPCDTGTSYHAKVVFPNASIDGNFSIAFGNEPSVHNFSCEALTDVCSTNKTFWDILIPDGEAA